MTTSNPEFIIYCGPMFSGKSSSLLSTLERYKYQHKRIAAFKPKLDDRYSQDEIVTHGGWKIPATCISDGADIIGKLSEMQENPHIIAVDEAFMIPNIADTLIWLYRNGFTIVVSSLEMSSTGNSFREIEKMFPWATKVKKCAAVCTICEKDAFYTHRKQTNSDEIVVGGSELYEPRCARHFPPIALT